MSFRQVRLCFIKIFSAQNCKQMLQIKFQIIRNDKMRQIMIALKNKCCKLMSKLYTTMKCDKL